MTTVEMAPGKAHRDMYIDSGVMQEQIKARTAILSGGVPGTVAGLFESAKSGKLSFDK
ncbi:MAG: hypothetical protein WDO16_13130 [Bacteroidota bacterium]